MTNDEAINVLKNAAWIGDEKQFYDFRDCSDAISRQAVIDTLCDWICGVGERIEAIPSVDVPDTNAGDMISRQVAISNCKARLYESALNSIGHECQADEVFRDIAEHRIGTWLEELPPVQPEPWWIPCSERLPEVGTYVLVSKKALGFRSNLPNVCTAHRSRDPRSGKEEWNDMLFGKLDDDDVLAWMPLPEPWEEGENE